MYFKNSQCILRQSLLQDKLGISRSSISLLPLINFTDCTDILENKSFYFKSVFCKQQY